MAASTMAWLMKSTASSRCHRESAHDPLYFALPQSAVRRTRPAPRGAVDGPSDGRGPAASDDRAPGSSPSPFGVLLDEFMSLSR
ncbi:hypothetical protein GCM10010275_53450 [Streptomyces litmocidini]|nr:hypothetical protein GCM10010275_53450 [Streptomyces litmocidini]